jgi:NADH-quinone oxidoreductase subunit J
MAPPSTPSPSVAGAVAFYALAALVVAGGLGVAFGRNLLRSALLLLATLSGVAGLYLFMGADFVGVTQVLVYVGGILVLLLFAVLFTSREGGARTTNPAAGRLLAIPIAAVLAAGAIVVAVRTPWRTTEPVATPTTQRIGDALLREYLFPFELVSIVLLVGLVGAIVLARRAAAAGRWRRTENGSP